jgi:hypothetical protein
MPQQTPAQVYRAVKAALEQHTELRASTVLLGNRTEPATILHRQFRLDPSSETNTRAYRDRPGLAQQVIESVTIHLSHDFIGSRAEACYQLATDDAVAAIDALYSGETMRAAGIAPTYDRTVRRQVGNHIEQDLVFGLRYDRALGAPGAA